MPRSFLKATDELTPDHAGEAICSSQAENWHPAPCTCRTVGQGCHSTTQKAQWLMYRHLTDVLYRKRYCSACSHITRPSHSTEGSMIWADKRQKHVSHCSPIGAAMFAQSERLLGGKNNRALMTRSTANIDLLDIHALSLWHWRIHECLQCTLEHCLGLYKDVVLITMRITISLPGLHWRLMTFLESLASYQHWLTPPSQAPSEPPNRPCRADVSMPCT